MSTISSASSPISTPASYGTGSSTSSSPLQDQVQADVQQLLNLQPGQDPTAALAKLGQDLSALVQQSGQAGAPGSDQLAQLLGQAAGQSSPDSSSQGAAQSDPSSIQAQLQALLQQLGLAPASASNGTAPTSPVSDPTSSFTPATQGPVAGIGDGHHHHGGHKLKAIASALNESPQQLLSQLQSGQSLSDIATAQGVPDLASAVAGKIGGGSDTAAAMTDQQKSALANAWISDVQNQTQAGSSTAMPFTMPGLPISP